MFNLPKELIDLVYSFDCTKRENFDKVIHQLKYNKVLNEFKDEFKPYIHSGGYTSRGSDNWKIYSEEITHGKLGLDEYETYIIEYMTDAQYYKIQVLDELNRTVKMIYNELFTEGEYPYYEVQYKMPYREYLDKAIPNNYLFYRKQLS